MSKKKKQELTVCPNCSRLQKDWKRMLKAIRRHCSSCMDQMQEECVYDNCEFYPYRMGTEKGNRKTK
jgi:predicted amidophosphoribosyltransferase